MCIIINRQFAICNADVQRKHQLEKSIEIILVWRWSTTVSYHMIFAFTLP